jgi:hypothetical protein
MDGDKDVVANFVRLSGANLAGLLTSVAPSPLVGGQSVQLSGSMYNNGNEPTTQPFWVEFWAVQMPQGYSGQLCDSVNVGLLGPGQSLNVADLVPTRTVNASIPMGTYAIEMRLDVLDEVGETIETDNVARWQSVQIVPDLPNLTVADFDFSPQDISPDGGSTMTFAARITNSGLRPTTGAFWVEFCIWPDLPVQMRRIFVADSMLVTETLTAGQTIGLPATPRMSLPVTEGVYYVGILVDAGDQIREQLETDNATWLIRKKLYVGPRPTRVDAWRSYK